MQKDERVSPERSRTLLLEARERGVSVSSLAMATGLHKGTLARLLHGSPAWVLQSTERAIERGVLIAYRRTRCGELSNRRLDPAPYRDKLRRLAAAGWPMRTLLPENGIPDNVFRDRATYVSPEVAAAVDALYERIGYTVGPSLAAARYWRARGYLVPAANAEHDMLALPITARQKRALGRKRRLRRERERAARRSRNEWSAVS